MAGARRGRPPKFGQPARAVVLTLPESVLDWLATIHTDPGWAIVSLFEQSGDNGDSPATRPQAPVAEIVQLTGRRGIILVSAPALQRLPGVQAVQLADGRALLALDPGWGLADLELAVVDRLEDTPGDSPDRLALLQFRRLLHRWRTGGLRFTVRSLLVAERATARTRQHLSTVAGRRAATRARPARHP